MGTVAVGTGTREGRDRDPRAAIREREILCLVCGRALRQLTNTHLRGHGLTADGYRQRFGYNRGTALMAQELRALYRERAVRVGLARQIRENPLRRDASLAARGPRRPIQLEEQLNRSEAARRAAALREARFRETGSHPRTKSLDLAVVSALRKEGLSLRQIARRLGVSPATISARLRPTLTRLI
ncbi:MAG: MucR family transcriptional regulator [candidate division NC10 bacterium]|nr:MucR family transcriptional regulator [candidate division NC10 bacterium]